MINKIQISNIATYKSISIIEPKNINFIYGGNGTGKTTLSRLIADEKVSSTSNIEWTNPEHEKVVCYNRDFIEHNFSEDKALPGIFTLGSESIDIQKEINNKKEEQDKYINQKTNEKKSYDQLIEKRNELNDKTKDKCWEIQVKFGAEFADALIGYRASKEKFFDKCLSFYSDNYDENLKKTEYEYIKETYRAAYTKEAEQVNEYNNLDLSEINNLDNFKLLSEVITGKSNTPIGTFIQFLNSSDWVKQGIEYAKKANGKCPYCQRDLPNDIVEQISDFFNKEYENNCVSLSNFQTRYISFISNIKNELEKITNNKYDFLKYEEFDLLLDQLSTISNSNIIAIQSKIETPSKIISIKPLQEILNKINKIIDDFNGIIKNNNAILADQNKAKKQCQLLVWHFFINQINDTLSDYNKQLSGLNKGIKNIDAHINQLNQNIRDCDAKIKEKESKLTSVIPTVIAINKILEGLGFTNFSLAENNDKPGTYLIIRPDGTDASRTLSEGEHNFISFLYFYHLCFGSQTNTGITNDKILVIDDPISSMDSNALFIIATMVKSIIQNCRKNERGIKQIFILTHNVYFHKEITFLGSRETFSKNEVAYFIIRKKDEESHIVFFSENPIKTTYEILWDELRHPSESSVKSVFNTMRRILEHYFQVIGEINYEECVNLFSGEDKIICRSLIAFINDGSHSIFDDLVVTFDETSLENYLRVFKLIFERLHHIDHYNMMMRINEK